MSVTQMACAGAYLFAGEANGVDIITHPNTYTGVESEAVVRVCIDPASINAAQMEIPIQNNINTFNRLQSTLGNVQVSGNGVNNNQIDFESVSLHEIGHCIGLAHVNLATESGVPAADRDYTKSTDGANNSFDYSAGADGVIGSSDDVRGDDVNLHWFRKSNNDPFTIDSVIDKTTYSIDIADLPSGNFVANADRDLSTLLSLPMTEAVMQQGTFFGETQRSLGHDDVATISYAASGLDETAGTSDDYTVRLEYGGISDTDCDVTVKFSTEVGFAACETGGQYIGNTGPFSSRVYNHIRITTASIEFNDGFNWVFNQETLNQEPAITSLDDQVVFEQTVLLIDISASDPDNDDLAITASGLPSFAVLNDNGDGTATITVSPDLGDESVSQVTVTATDDGLPNVSSQVSFQLTVNIYDTDGDGLSDPDEINIYLTSPTNPDSDGDFIDDGDEVNNGSDPNDDTSWPNFADGDIAPLGNPDGLINAGDYLLMQRIALGDLTAGPLELSHGDLYPEGSPDGVINISDLIQLLKLVQP
jgi:hypothetical protein